MKNSSGKQICGFIPSPDWIDNPKKSFPYLKEMAEHGYLATILFMRHQTRTVLDPSVARATRVMAQKAHQYGLKFLLDTDPTIWSAAFTEQHSEAALWQICRFTATVLNGKFEFHAFYPPGGWHSTSFIFNNICAVFRKGRAGYQPAPVAGISYDWMNVASPKPGVLIKGKFSKGESGVMVFYVLFRQYNSVDMAHPVVLKGMEKMLDLYAGIPLDGFTWDEPGKGISDLASFKAGAGFLRFFKQQNGYDLIPRLIYLDHLDNTPPAVKLRHDYYHTLVEMNTVAQDSHNRYARKLFGKNLIFGTHQTWSGLPADLAGGVIDYFKMGKVLTAAWTDGGWITELKYPTLHFMLAEGLKKELQFRDAYYNDWGARAPAIEDMRFANRFKMLFHVNWFNIFFSEISENIVNYRHEPLKTFAKKDVENLDAFDRLVGDAFIPQTDVAMLFNWDGVAAAPKWMTRTFYTAMANTALHLTDRGIFAAFMSGGSILKAKIHRGYFFVGPAKYKVLVVPYANAIQGNVYRRIIEIAAAGIPVIFFGPPPEFIAETGRSIANDFAGRVGMQPLTNAEYMAAYAEQSPLPDIHEWEPSWVEFYCPLTITRGLKIENNEQKVLGIKAPAQALYYMPLPDPREDLVNLVEKLTTAPAGVFAAQTYVRFFSDPKKPERCIVLAVAKAHIPSFAMPPDVYGSLRPPIKELPLKALVRFKEGDLEMKGGTWCAVKLEKGITTQVLGDCPVIRWNGKDITRL